MSRVVLRTWAIASIVACAGAAVGCSLLNQEGPTVTCEELLCGKINACEDGIIAQCVDGQTLKYHACELADACEQSWQVKGAYRCAVETTDCEGCRPERDGCVGATGSTSSTEATSASSVASSTTDASSSAEASSSADASSSAASSSSDASSSTGL